MPLWDNKPIELYHGTDTHSLAGYAPAVGDPLAGFAVDLRRCRENTDFGRGFYMTTSEIQARNWANGKVNKQPRRARSAAVVLAFKVERDWLAKLDALCFVLPSNDFFDLVEDCRNGVLPHQRTAPQHEYDVVYGPVTLWPQDMAVGSGDQVSLHTARAALELPIPTVFDIASTPTGRFPRVRRRL